MRDANPDATDEQIRFTQLPNAQYNRELNKKAQQETNDTMNKWQRKSTSQYSDLDEYF